MVSLGVMRKFVVAMVLGAVVATASAWTAVEAEVAAPSERDVVDYIIGGSDADAQWSSIVVRIVNSDNELCSGSFISAKWVLTAGHCIASRATIYYGSTAVSTLSSAGGARGIRHDLYDEDSAPRFDFGLYELDSPAPVDESTLPDVLSYDDTWAWQKGFPAITIGWGLTADDGPKATVLQSAGLTVEDRFTCRELDRDIGAAYSPTSAICATSPTSSACNGDSGGPLLGLGPNGEYEIIGVTSYGPSSCGGHSVFAFAPSGLPWIRQVTGLSLGSAAPYSSSRIMSRIYGADRYETASSISSIFWGSTDSVFVATGAKFPDALAAGAAAGVFGIPILLVTPTGVPQSTRDEIARLRPDTIFVAGGTAAVSDQTAADLAAIAGSSVERFAGVDRYDTAQLITNRVWPDRSGGRVWMASGRSFADPLIASAAAAVFQEPFVLVDGITPVPEHTRALLARLAPAKIVLVGPTSAFSDAVRQSLSGLTAQLQLLDSDDVSLRSSAVWGDFATSEWASVATLEKFPDALAAVAFSSRQPRSPLMLIPRTCVPAVVQGQLDRLDTERVVIFGGPQALDERIESLAPC